MNNEWLISQKLLKSGEIIPLCTVPTQEAADAFIKKYSIRGRILEATPLPRITSNLTPVDEEWLFYIY